MLILLRRDVVLIFLVLLSLVCPAGASARAATTNRGRGATAAGSVIGTVHDQSGKPLAGALIVFLRQGAAEIVKQARTGVDGRFTARLAAGSYSLRAAADGFQPVAFEAVQITPSSELVYRFNLEPVGSGRTAPERRTDRNETKWRLRAAQGRRSIFQISEQHDETVAALLGQPSEKVDAVEATEEATQEEEARAPRTRPQGVVETYAAASADAFGVGSVGLNFAVAQPLARDVSLIFAGQSGWGAAAQRLEAAVSARANAQHRVTLGAGAMRVQAFGGGAANYGGDLGQVSLRALDEWTVRDGVIVVLGMDYSRFAGAHGGGDVLSPRLGVQYDLDSMTRLRAAYAPGGGQGEHAMSAARFEDQQVIFHEARLRPVAADEQGRALAEKSQRLEIGIERELDLNSQLEATAFFDTTENRGVGLFSAPVSAFVDSASEDLLQVAQQQGAARGLRVLYSRRLTPTLKASAGYSFGRGQALSAFGVSDPAKLWTSGFFQTAAAQVEATLSSGTRVRTVFRFSPRATVFAIDPFAGRLAVYDPSLSFYVTQELPAFGLPVRAEAVLDARNLLDMQAGGVDDGETALLIGTNRRSVRGGISLRF